ncbi:MAG: hypothetical protein BGO12_00815 [Verrucomicrobia bacterium 61-8]|nr:ComEC/Rec2 family competence protein [Verrucomicrobiota bacterium]OJV07493.1 MAG: hypothetical protein BGO12_00815 [Verrucomicrobia bacterium 61-8]
MKTVSPLRQRLPFASLLVPVAGGIVFSQLFQPALAFVATVAALSLLLFGISCVRWTESMRGWWFSLFLAAAVAVVHLVQSTQSPAAIFAHWLGDHRVPAVAEGTVVTEPSVFSPRSARFEFRLDSLTMGDARLAAPITIQVRWRGAAPQYGDRLRISGQLSNITPPRNPGQFDAAAWSQRKNIRQVIEVLQPGTAELLDRNQGNPLVRLSISIREWMISAITYSVDDPEVSNLLAGMILGDTADISQSIQEAFRATGTYHLFSVSGLHVGIMAIILWYALKTLRLPRKITAALIIPLLFFYVLMTGLKAASIRAAVMGSIILIGLMAERRPVLFNNLCAAAFLILLTDTNQLFNAGFQLSFGVVASILLLSAIFERRLEEPLAPDPFIPHKLLSPARRFGLRTTQFFAGLTAVSLAAWLGSFPLTAGYFHLVSFSALPANLIAVPLSFGIMCLTALSVCSFLVSPWLAGIFNQTNWLLTKALLVSVQTFSHLPASHVFLPPLHRPEQVVIFDAGAGGAACIQSQGRTWIIDCGPQYFTDSVIVPYLRSQGVRRLDGLIITHGDANHMGGAENLILATQPRLVLDSGTSQQSPTRKKLLASLETRGIAPVLVRAGHCEDISPAASLEILYPPAVPPKAVADNLAIVALLTLDGRRILLASDIGSLAETWLLENARERLACDILVQGTSHAGRTTPPDFLEAASPCIVIATAADFPETERIPGRWAEQLARQGITLIRQDETGAVVLTLSDGKLTAKGFLNHATWHLPQ